MRPIWRLIWAALSRLVEPSMRAASMASAASMPRADLSCITLLFAARVGRAAQVCRLGRVRPACQLDLDAVADRAPAALLGQLGGELAQLGFGRAADVTPPGLTQ